MIAPAVQAELKKFKSFWEPYLAVSPFLALDGSWFSIGVIDAITFPLRRKSERTGFEKGILRGASAYLAVFAAECWESFGAQTIVEFQDTGIVLRAVEGPNIETGTEVCAHVERDLIQLIETLPRPFPIFANFSRVVSDVENLVSPFTFALSTGLLPSIEGAWENENPESFSPQIEKVEKRLATGCALAYARSFPEETWGQVAELYLQGLIYPLTAQAEDLPVRAAVHGVLEFAKEFKLPKNALQALTYNLSRLADERTAQTGFVVYAAISPGVMTPELLARGYYWGYGAGVLRQAFRDVCSSYLGLKEDWLDKDEFSELDTELIRKEYRLCFLPWVKLPLSRLLASSSTPRIRKMLKALAEFDITQGMLQLDQMVDENPEDFDIRLQRIHLELVNADFENADSELRKLQSENGSENLPQMYNLLGMFQLGQGNSTQAEKHLRSAQRLSLAHPILYAEINNNLGWFYLLSGKFEDAHRAFDESLRVVPEAINVLLNKSTALHQEAREEEAAVIDRRLLELSPLERAVFRGLIYDPAVPEPG